MTKLGKQAHVLGKAQIGRLLGDVADDPRATVMVLLSIRAGLRACEIARVTWAMATDADGEIADVLRLPNIATKGKTGGRVIPLHKDLRRALAAFKPAGVALDRPIVLDGRGFPMSANATVQWFRRLYERLGFQGMSSHSGRRTFITSLARTISTVGGSLRDVQELAGHSSLSTTQVYIERHSGAQSVAVNML